MSPPAETHAFSSAGEGACDRACEHTINIDFVNGGEVTILEMEVKEDGILKTYLLSMLRITCNYN